VSTSIQQRQRQCLQIKPAFPFGVAVIQAVPLDAMLSEFMTDFRSERESWCAKAI
jgi:hypothetical protein